jgi:hypothetical protein
MSSMYQHPTGKEERVQAKMSDYHNTSRCILSSASSSFFYLLCSLFFLPSSFLYSCFLLHFWYVDPNIPKLTTHMQIKTNTKTPTKLELEATSNIKQATNFCTHTAADVFFHQMYQHLLTLEEKLTN